ncbi:MAG: hypothetical protein Q9195_004643 [Heterodermia aff. obscurata]
MIAACVSGDLEELQQLLSAAGAKAGDAPVELTWESNPIPPSGPAVTSTLMAYAVINARLNILTYLLTIYPTAPVKSVLGSALAHPDSAVFTFLHARDPSIVNHEVEPRETALMVACRDGASNPLLPAFLLEHGADPNGLGTIAGPLYYAVQYGQPLPLIDKMVAAGARVRTPTIIIAVRERRFDVARYFLEKCRIEDEQDLEKYVGKDVSESGSQELQTAFGKRVEKRARRGVSSSRGSSCAVA